MGQHHRNPTAIANNVPRKEISVIPIGGGYAVAGLTLAPLLDSEGNLCAVLSVVAGRISDLVPFQPMPLVLGELCKIPQAQLRQKIAEMLGDVEVALEDQGAT
jgi:hypothetical protein